MEFAFVARVEPDAEIQSAFSKKQSGALNFANERVMENALHFVRFDPLSERFHRAVKALGSPDFLHRNWDHRAVAEIMPGDTVVFAIGDERQPIVENAYDDSAVQ